MMDSTSLYVMVIANVATIWHLTLLKYHGPYSYAAHNWKLESRTSPILPIPSAPPLHCHLELESQLSEFSNL